MTQGRSEMVVRAVAEAVGDLAYQESESNYEGQHGKRA